MLRAEQLLLLALNTEKGRPGLGKRDALEPELCGALASERDQSGHRQGGRR